MSDETRPDDDAADDAMEPLRIVFEFRLNDAKYPIQRLRITGDKDALGGPISVREYFSTNQLGESSWRDVPDQRIPVAIFRRLALILYLRGTMPGTNRTAGLSPEARNAVELAEAEERQRPPCFRTYGNGNILVVDMGSFSEKDWT